MLFSIKVERKKNVKRVMCEVIKTKNLEQEEKTIAGVVSEKKYESKPLEKID